MPNRIPIKINQTENASQQDIKKALNLNRVFSGGNAEPKSKKTSLLWLISIIILLMAVLGLAAKIWLDSQKSFSQYNDLIGPETKTAVIFKIDRLESIAGLASVELKKGADFYPWLKEQISVFLADSQVSLQNDIIPVLQGETFFLVLPSENNNFAWVAGGKIKTEQSFQAQKMIEKIELGLRKNFGTNESLYRQTKINSAYSFNQINKPYYWSQIGEFILISNDLSGIQKIIDKIISK